MCTNLDVGLIASDWTRLKKILLEGRRRGEGERRRGDEYVVLGDFLSELQALRRGKRGRHLNNSRETPEVTLFCSSDWPPPPPLKLTQARTVLEQNYFCLRKKLS